jgi:hypothetical protein
MELNICVRNLTSLNSILIKFTAVNGPWNINYTNPQFSKAHVTNMKFNNFEMIEVMGLKIIALRYP